MINSIGKVVEVNSEYNIVKVKLFNFELLPTYNVQGVNEITLNIHVGSLLKTKIGFNELVLEIYKESFDQETKGSEFSIYECKIIGRIDFNTFYNNIKIYPILNAGIFPLSKKDYNLIYNQTSNENSIYLGENARKEDLKIFVDFEKIINSHIGLFGNTGSGKSNTLAHLINLLNNFCEKSKNIALQPNFQIFDVNNEFGSNAIVDEKHKNIYIKKNKVEIKYTDLNEDILIELLNATEKTQEPIIRKSLKKFNEILIKYHNNDSKFNTFFAKEYEKTLEKVISNVQIPLVKVLINLIDEFDEGSNNNFSKKFKFSLSYGNAVISYNNDTLINQDINKNQDYLSTATFDKVKVDVQKILNSSQVIDASNKINLLIFLMIKYSSYANINEKNQLEWLVPIINRTITLFLNLDKYFVFVDEVNYFYEKKINVFQLDDLDFNTKYAVVLLISNAAFNKCKDSRNNNNNIANFYNMLVIDEAHNFFQNQDKTLEKSKGNFFTKLIREGRKYGLFLLVSSQRPSDLPQSFLSQIHNFFIHKLINERDIDIIRKSNSFIDSKTINQLSNLDVGECTVSGLAFSRPEILCVSVNKNFQPNSANISWFKKSVEDQ